MFRGRRLRELVGALAHLNGFLRLRSRLGVIIDRAQVAPCCCRFSASGQLALGLGLGLVLEVAVALHAALYPPRVFTHNELCHEPQSEAAL